MFPLFLCAPPYALLFCQTSLNSTIGFGNTSRAVPQRFGEDCSNISYEVPCCPSLRHQPTKSDKSSRRFSQKRQDHRSTRCLVEIFVSDIEDRSTSLKIHKASILVFKDRDRCVTGEHRFRRGYSRDPRKMVKLWAEKEMRNLRRLHAAGVHSPEPVEIRENVPVMSFIGNSEGW